MALPLSREPERSKLSVREPGREPAAAPGRSCHRRARPPAPARPRPPPRGGGGARPPRGSGPGRPPAPRPAPPARQPGPASRGCPHLTPPSGAPTARAAAATLYFLVWPLRRLFLVLLSLEKFLVDSPRPSWVIGGTHRGAHLGRPRTSALSTTKQSAAGHSRSCQSAGARWSPRRLLWGREGHGKNSRCFSLSTSYSFNFSCSQTCAFIL